MRRVSLDVSLLTHGRAQPHGMAGDAAAEVAAARQSAGICMNLARTASLPSRPPVAAARQRAEVAKLDRTVRDRVATR